MNNEIPGFHLPVATISDHHSPIQLLVFKTSAGYRVRANGDITKVEKAVSTMLHNTRLTASTDQEAIQQAQDILTASRALGPTREEKRKQRQQDRQQAQQKYLADLHQYLDDHAGDDVWETLGLAAPDDRTGPPGIRDPPKKESSAQRTDRG